MAVDLIKRPAAHGEVPRAALLTFLRAAGLPPRDVVGLSVDVYRVRATVVHRNADGDRWTTPDGELVTYTAVREIR